MKDFQHRDKLWYVRPETDPDWEHESRMAIHVPDKINTLDENVQWHKYYVKQNDTMYQIGLRDLIDKRRKLKNGRWHIAVEDLTIIPITPEMRKQINEYGR